MQGKIIDVLNFGTIVRVLVENVEGVFCVNFDHRPFGHLIEAEGNIIGREIEYDSAEGIIRFAEAG